MGSSFFVLCIPFVSLEEANQASLHCELRVPSEPILPEGRLALDRQDAAPGVSPGALVLYDQSQASRTAARCGGSRCQSSQARGGGCSGREAMWQGRCGSKARPTCRRWTSTRRASCHPGQCLPPGRGGEEVLGSANSQMKTPIQPYK